MPKAFLCILVFLPCISRAVDRANPNLPLDRPFSLKNSTPFILEREYGRIARGQGRALTFSFPGPCLSMIDGSQACEERSGAFRAADSAGGDIIFSPLVAEEYRAGDHGAWATEAGGIISGGKGPASFQVDARVFTETNRDRNTLSFDREDIDTQIGSVTGTVSYTSYARYRGDFDLDLPFGRLTAARDAIHWGPGLYANLSFQQNAVPFNFLSYSGRIGPVSVTSVYGKLVIGSSAAFSRESLNDRNLYAHRYELRLGPDWLLAVSEQMILFENNNAFLFVPIFPLFIAKSFIFEESNNGNVSFDVTHRLNGIGLLYGEFLLDDLESPTSLVTRNYVQNKWALMVGGHFAKEFRSIETGLILEYSRVEPWVYTHFDANTSQTANMGYPLGNPWGPNSQAMVGKVYARPGSDWYFSLKSELVWKGTDAGSGLNDASPHDPLAPKAFLGGNVDFGYAISPSLSFTRKWTTATLTGDFGTNPSISARLAVQL